MTYCQATLLIDEFSITIKINNKNILKKIACHRATLLRRNFQQLTMNTSQLYFK